MGALCGKEEFLLLDAVKECDCDADIEYIKQLLSGTADRDPIDINQCDDAQWTALHFLCTSHVHKLEAEGKGDVVRVKLEVLDLLIGSGAQLRAESRSGATPLMEASFNGFDEAAEKLIAGGAEINHLNSGGRNAMHLAAEQGHIEIVQYLLDAGVNGKQKDKNGKTAFDYGTDDAKKAINAFNPEFGDDMESLMESRDLAELEQMEAMGNMHDHASQELYNEANDRRAARRIEGVEKTGQLTVKVEKLGRGDVAVTIFKGKGMKDMDFVGKNDVFVTAHINEQQQRTKTVQDAGDAPVWEQGRGQILTFKKIRGIKELKFRVFDEDPGVGGTTADLIGQFIFPEHRLPDLNGKAAGDGWEADVGIRKEDDMDEEVGTTSAQYLDADGKDPNATESQLDGLMSHNPLSKILS